MKIGKILNANLTLLILLTFAMIYYWGVRLRSSFYWNLGNIYWLRANITQVDNNSSFAGASYFWSLAFYNTPQHQENLLLYLGSAYEQAGKLEDAKLVWQKLTQPVEGLLNRGQTWLDLKAPIKALPWFRGVTLVKPQIVDGWYYLAQAYMENGQADLALLNLRQALQAPQSTAIKKSEIYFLIGYTYHYITQPTQIDKALLAYRSALLIQDFSSLQQVAETHFRICDALWASDVNPEHYASECRKAIALNPKHLLARFLLGIAVYNQTHNVELAEQEFQTALEIEDSPWGLIMLARYVYEPSGLTEKARETYNLVLQRWPTFELARQYLNALK